MRSRRGIVWTALTDVCDRCRLIGGYVETVVQFSTLPSPPSEADCKLLLRDPPGECAVPSQMCRVD